MKIKKSTSTLNWGFHRLIHGRGKKYTPFTDYSYQWKEKVDGRCTELPALPILSKQSWSSSRTLLLQTPLKPVKPSPSLQKAGTFGTPTLSLIHWWLTRALPACNPPGLQCLSKQQWAHAHVLPAPQTNGERLQTWKTRYLKGSLMFQLTMCFLLVPCEFKYLRITEVRLKRHCA